MLIILEGPDGAGKSTLVHRLMARLGERGRVTLIHRGPPTKHPLDEYVVPLLDYEPGKNDHIICDRWHLGEWVYPRLLDRKTHMDDAVLAYVDMFLKSRGAVTVTLLPPLDTVIERFTKRGDDTRTVDEIPIIHKLFTDISTTHAQHVFTDDDPSPDVVLAVATYRESLVNHMRFRTEVGSPEPRVLMFGDVRGCPGGDECQHKKYQHPQNSTAFMPYPLTSGHYLLDTMSHAMSLDGVLFANACDVDNPVEVWNLRGRPNVVALGRNAHEELVKQRIPHASVPHPQYIRRFHHQWSLQYGDLIRELIGTKENRLTWRPSLDGRVSGSTKKW